MTIRHRALCSLVTLVLLALSPSSHAQSTLWVLVKSSPPHTRCCLTYGHLAACRRGTIVQADMVLDWPGSVLEWDVLTKGGYGESCTTRR